MNKFAAWEKLRFDVLFVGDDWYKTPTWVNMQKRFDEVGVRIVYFPYTTGTSSTLINDILMERRADLTDERAWSTPETGRASVPVGG